ncbi:UDP-N-acetyl-D-mannosamine dehydrogenase [Luminiphilus sp.]|nr:UDP-N-acetyl-D-mannosamine dehydrogenase [Luminiphilus sp.]
MIPEKINIVGLGYIGLPTAAVLASNGYRVFGCDTNTHVVDTVNRGEIHIVEPGLEEAVKSSVKAGLLTAHNEPQAADVHFICVPTPFLSRGGIPQPDISYVLDAASKIAPLLKPGNAVILESTCPIGTLEEIYQHIEGLGAPVTECWFAYCPERVLPGRIMIELTENDRIVGGHDQDAASEIAEFYKTFVSGEVHQTDGATAEMCKLAENSFRDVNIAFANELSMIAATNDVDISELIKVANLHPRVNILSPGPGVGGHCIAVDPWFLVAADPSRARLIQRAREVNLAKTDWVIDQICSSVATFRAERMRSPVVTCLGLTFKPDIDDVRTSPALQIVSELKGRGITLRLVEPNLDEFSDHRLSSLADGLNEGDLIVILVAHTEFKENDVIRQIRDKAAMDFCGVLS